MNSTVTCQNYFRLPLCSCEALINFKVCIKEANLPFLSTVPIYYSVSLLEKNLAYRVFEKRTGTPVYPNVCLQKSMSTTTLDFLYSLGSSCNSYQPTSPHTVFIITFF